MYGDFKYWSISFLVYSSYAVSVDVCALQSLPLASPVPKCSRIH
jgi:hypothetical protein